MGTKTKTSFGKDNQPKKRRGKTERTKILEAFERTGRTEDGFYDLLIDKAHDPEDSFSFKELLTRLSPVPKATSPTVQFEFPDDAKPHVQASYVLKAVSSGQIPSDIGQMFVSSIKAMIDIEEYTDLKERIEKIEATLNGDITS